MRPREKRRQAAVLLSFLFGALLALVPVAGSEARAGDRADVPISAFVGDYVGEAEVINADGTKTHRNLSVQIRETKDGFSVAWTTVTHKPSGKTSEKYYEIEFRPSVRHGIYSAVMRRNLFGHGVPLDPMKGEPYVWGRIVGRTMTVYSLFIDDDGGYEIQKYDRTLAEGGLELSFARFRNGEKLKTVTTFLKRK